LDVFAYVYADVCIMSGIDETQDGRHDLIQRDRGADLVIGCSPQQRLDSLQVGQDAVKFYALWRQLQI